MKWMLLFVKMLYFQSQMKENEKEREDMNLKKPKLRTDFIDAHMDSDYVVINSDLPFSYMF